VPLSTLQSQLLQKMNVPKDLQEAFAYQLGENGLPKSPDAPDFLMVLTDQFQKTESHLLELRKKLGLVSIGKLPKSKFLGEEITQETVEEVIKQEWVLATALWRTTDQVVAQAKNYGITLSRHHVQFALDKKNLAVVEMIKFAKPEFFKVKKPLFIKAYLTSFIGILAGVSGFYGGLIGGARQGFESNIGITAYISAFFYALLGIVRGWAMATVSGARFGLQTGNIKVAIKLGYASALINPFHDAPGSKYQQEEQLVVEEVIFKLAEQ